MIFFYKQSAQQIVDLLDQAIANRAVRSWVKVDDVEYVNTSPKWRRKARFRAVVQFDGLLMKLLMEDDIDDPRACYAYMHGALLQTMLQHCSAKLFKIEVSGDPGHGDTPFDD